MARSPRFAFYAAGSSFAGASSAFADRSRVYSLRRWSETLGVIRLILENRIRLPLLPLLTDHYQRFDLTDRDDPSAAVLAFIADRLKVALKDQGARHDLISAVFSTGGEDDLYRLIEQPKVRQ